MKRAQRSRLEDQRGTKINFELPDFLKDKEIFAINKLRKVKPLEPVPLARTVDTGSSSSAVQIVNRPQPAPRLSILKASGGGGVRSASPSLPSPPVLTTTTEDLYAGDNGGGDRNETIEPPHIDEHSMDAKMMHSYVKGPPPLPPKPKILPIKPSNWGQSPNKSSTDAWH